MALRMADLILLVAQLELSSLRNVVRLDPLPEREENLGGQGPRGGQPARVRTRWRKGSV